MQNVGESDESFFSLGRLLVRGLIICLVNVVHCLFVYPVFVYLGAEDDGEYYDKDRETAPPAVLAPPEPAPGPANAPPILGVNYTPPSSATLQREGLDANQGVEVRRVHPGTAAQDMGIQPGDVIISINETPIDSMQSVRNEVLTGAPGEDVGVVVRRGGEDIELKGQYHEWPDHIPYSPIDQDADRNYRDMVQRRLNRQRSQVAENLPRQIDRLAQDAQDMGEEAREAADRLAQNENDASSGSAPSPQAFDRQLDSGLNVLKDLQLDWRFAYGVQVDDVPQAAAEATITKSTQESVALLLNSLLILCPNNSRGSLVMMRVPLMLFSFSFQLHSLYLRLNLEKIPAVISGGKSIADRPFFGVVPTVSDAGEVLVHRVLNNTTAAEIGLKKGDIIKNINGQPVQKREDLSRILQDIGVGKKMTVTYTRDGASKSATGTLRSRSSMSARTGTKDASEMLSNISELRKEIAEVRGMLMRAGVPTTPEQDLATTLAELGQTLNALPDRLETVSKEFKKIYPNGVFDVQINIDIRSNKDAGDEALQLGPGETKQEQGAEEAP